MTDVTPMVELQAHGAPGPGARVARTAGQAGGALVMLELWQAFGWFGSDEWSADRWKAVTAAAVFLVALVQNVVNWWRTERLPLPAVGSVTVTAVEPPAPTRPDPGMSEKAPPRRRR